MKNYEAYTIEDFIQDDDFRDWVQGQGNQAYFWDAFLEKYPEKQTAFRQAEQFIRVACVSPEPISEAVIRRQVAQFIEKASSLTPRKRLPGPLPGRVSDFSRQPRALRRGIAVAVMLTGIVGIGWWYQSVDSVNPGRKAAQRQHAGTVSGQLVETSNPTTEQLRVVLNDSSEVMLSPESVLRYPAQFTDEARIVYLTGEATFSVKRQHRPFMVYTGETVTKVLGTRFVVRAFDTDRKITVQVLSGKVQVYREKQGETYTTKEVNGLILTVNQAAIVEKNAGNLIKTLVANPSLVAGSKGVEPQFVYDEEPLPDIFRQMEQRYGIPIQFDEQSFEGCKITAALTSETLYEKLNLLCKAASASYEITDGQILISRKNYK